MTPTRPRTRPEDPAHAPRFLKKTDELYRSAETNLMNSRWNAASTDAIHAAILAADAALVQAKGHRNAGDHQNVVRLLRQDFGAAAEGAIAALTRLLVKKHETDYESRLATEQEARDAVARAQTIYAWARSLVPRIT